MRQLLALVAAAGVGLLAAFASLTALPGCGGCGHDSAPTSFTPAAPDCLAVSASFGWGCFAGSNAIGGTNACTVPLTFPVADTNLTADLVVVPGATFEVAVPGSTGGRATDFVLDLGGEALTLHVDW